MSQFGTKFFLLLLGVLGGSAFSVDELHFRDGAVLKGRVVSQDGDGVRFGVTSSSGREVVLDYKWHELERVVLAGRSPNASSETEPKKETEQPQSEPAEKARPVEKPSSVRELIQGDWLNFSASTAIVPLNGVIGEDSLAHPWYVEWMIDQAVSQSLSLLVFELDTKGGYTAAGQDIQDLFLASNENLTIAVWIKEAGSAGAGIAASVERRFVSSTARIGAAQTVMKTPDGETVSKESVNQGADQRVVEKFASYSRAQLRVIEQKTGFPRCVLSAMSSLESELWWSQDAGFSDSSVGDSKKIDGEDELLTFTGDELYSYRLAEAQVDSITDLKEHLSTRVADLRNDVYEAFSLLDDVFEKEDEWILEAHHHYHEAHDALGLSIAKVESFFPYETFDPSQRLRSTRLRSFTQSLQDFKRELGAAFKSLKKCEYRRDRFFDFGSVCVVDFQELETLFRQANRIRPAANLGSLHDALIEMYNMKFEFDWCFESEEEE